MGYQPYSSGFQRLAASGVIGDSGKPVLMYGYSLESGAALANPFAFSGTTNAGSFTKLGATVASTANVISLPFPVMFPSGLYISFDANTSAITIFYSLQSVTS